MSMSAGYFIKYFPTEPCIFQKRAAIVGSKVKSESQCSVVVMQLEKNDLACHWQV